MTPLNEQISAARKALGLTQEQLAAQINVSRQMVSHWETGRAVPEGESAEKLYALLKIGNDAMPSAAEPRKKTRFPVWYAVLFLLGVAVGFALAFGVMELKREPAAPDPVEINTDLPGNPPPVYDYAWYQQPNVKQEGAAHLGFSLVQDPVMLVERDREPYVGWNVDFRFREQTGTPFTMTVFAETYYAADQQITYSNTFRGDEILFHFNSLEVPSDANFRYSTFKPVDDSVQAAFRIEGVDANGNELVFRYVFPLYQGDQP